MGKTFDVRLQKVLNCRLWIEEGEFHAVSDKGLNKRWNQNHARKFSPKSGLDSINSLYHSLGEGKEFFQQYFQYIGWGKIRFKATL